MSERNALSRHQQQYKQQLRYTRYYQTVMFYVSFGGPYIAVGRGPVLSSARHDSQCRGQTNSIALPWPTQNVDIRDTRGDSVQVDKRIL